MILKSLQTGLVVLTATAAACSTMGTGEGDMRGGGPGVRFDWKAEDAVHGQLTATLANGKTYEGKLFQITSDTRVEEVEPLWVGWHRHWREWGYWNPGPEFITHYSGRVVANRTNSSDPSTGYLNVQNPPGTSSV